MPPIDVVLVCQRGAAVDAEVKYGALRAMVEVAREMTRRGRRCVLAGLAAAPEGLSDSVPFVGAPDDRALRRRVRTLAGHPALIACSRADVLVDRAAPSRVVYHHGPHPPEGDFSLRIIRSLRIPVVVVSRSSRALQTSLGVPDDLLSLAYNGFDVGTFLPDRAPRHARRIVFAGHGVFYKGLDIAIAAFRELRREFPDAEFHVYGSGHAWPASGTHWPAGWLNEHREPDWQTIQSGAPGARWMGEANATELAAAFRRASILVMPSRIPETFGMVSVEAQACGCIPVLPEHGGFAETMDPARTGYLYTPNTPEALAATVADLWRRGAPEPEQRARAEVWARERFSWGDAASRMLELIDAGAGGGREWRRRYWHAAASAKGWLRLTRDAAIGAGNRS